MAQVGPQTLSDSINASARIAKDGSHVFTPDFQEFAYRGQLFILDSDSVTLAGANTTKGAMGTIKLINGIYNPPSSGKVAVLLRTHVSLVSGTATGPFMYNFFATTQLSNAATGTIRNAYINSSVASSMTPEVGVVLATTPAVTTNCVQLGCVGGPAAVAAGAGNNDAFDDVRGSIIIPPGVVFGLTQVGASTAVVQSTMWWIEIPV